MITRVVILVVFFLYVLEATPTNYQDETCPRFDNEDDDLIFKPVNMKARSRIGLKKLSKTLSKASEPPEPIDEDDELNSLFNSFWAIDNLPKKSTYVSIKKLPDVYMDQSDQPSPISDAIALERSEITEEARDLRVPEFGERPLYDPSMQMMDTIGNKNYQGYPDAMAYPQYPVYNAPQYNAYNYNITQAPQEIGEIVVNLQNDLKKDIEEPDQLVVENITEVSASTDGKIIAEQTTKEELPETTEKIVTNSTQCVDKIVDKSTTVIQKKEEQTSMKPSVNIEKIPKKSHPVKKN